jgi:DNA replication and repair protein RecF
MYVSRLWIQNLRSLSNIEIEPTDGINIILGPNGSGKTTILEAIYLLHSGKSFRNGNIHDLVKHGERKLIVQGEIAEDSTTDLARRFRVTKQGTRTEIQVDSVNVKSASKLSQMFPVLTFDANSFGVIEGGPKLRRSLIDRAVFHVEPSYLSHMQRFLKALQHRNRLLKEQPNTERLTFWNNEFTEAAEIIDQTRQKCVQTLNTLLQKDFLIANLGQVSLEYRRGWNNDFTLEQVLLTDHQRDLSTGSTQSGPHKAELKIKIFEKNAAMMASRGQIKTIVLATVAIVAEFIFTKTGRKPVFLIDDISSELDSDWCSRAVKRIEQSNAQAFITTTDTRMPMYRNPPGRTFHVKQGNIQHHTASFS